MIIDINAWLGVWPFRALRDNTPETLAARLDSCGIQKAAVSPIEAVFHRNVQLANEKLVEDIESFRDRFIPLATLNPTYTHWEDDLKACHEDLNMKGVRLFPQYQNFPIDGPLAQSVAKACAERNLPIFIPHRLEDVARAPLDRSRQCCRCRRHCQPARGCPGSYHHNPQPARHGQLCPLAARGPAR